MQWEACCEHFASAEHACHKWCTTTAGGLTVTSHRLTAAPAACWHPFTLCTGGGWCKPRHGLEREAVVCGLAMALAVVLAMVLAVWLAVGLVVGLVLALAPTLGLQTSSQGARPAAQ